MLPSLDISIPENRTVTGKLSLFFSTASQIQIFCL